jgi:hypothetical protein
VPLLSATELILVAVAVAIGALVQGSVGFGFALVSAPVIALVEPGALPATVLLLSVPLNVAVAWQERAHADLTGFHHLIGGLVVGTGGGTVIMATMSTASLSAVFGGAIIAMAGLSAIRPAREHHGHPVRMAAGVASGLINTVSGTGGPPIALLYHRRPGPQLRSTLAMAFLVALALALTGLVIAGRLRWEHFVVALALVPALATGLVVSRVVARFLDRRWLQPAVLTFAAASGLAALLRAVV